MMRGLCSECGERPRAPSRTVCIPCKNERDHVPEYKPTLEDWVRNVVPSKAEWGAVMLAAKYQVAWMYTLTSLPAVAREHAGPTPESFTDAVTKDWKRSAQLMQVVLALVESAQQERKAA